MLKSVYQHTVSDNVVIAGIGVHSGAAARLVIRPAGPGTGFCFIRTDIKDRDNIVPARWDNVVDTRLCTMLGNKAGVTVSTVEHLMAACAAVGLDNAVFEIDGPEIPIMDGSALPFIEAIDRIGLMQSRMPRRVLVVKKSVTVTEGDKEASLSPADGQYFGFEIDFASPVIGRQKYLHQLKEKSFRNEISAARTFGFLHEAEALRQMGLGRGGSLENAIIVDNAENRVVNPEGLRFKNEFVRHKVLDAVGDIFLAGGQLIGHYHGIKAGHAMNNKLLHALFADSANYAFVALNQETTRATARGTLSAQPVPALA